MSDPIPRLNAALEGRYKIERELGEGGMATVYLADDLRHERKVALKVLKPELAAVVGADRFLAEIKTTANLQHPHVLPLFDSGEADGFLFYVMPFVEGESLHERLHREKQLPVDEAVRIATEVAEALHYAHGRDVVHRDIKPANILLQGGRVLVADFGIALAVSAAGAKRLTETGLSVGTPQYMSPEQATGDRELDGRSDVYSLGCIAYEMLAGDPPYTASTAQAILGKILTEDAKPLAEIRRSVPPHVEAAVHAAIEKLPADRFTSARELAAALAGERPVPARRGRAAALTTGARPWTVAAFAAAIGLAAGLLLDFGPTAETPVGVAIRFEVPVQSGLSMTWGDGLPTVSPDGTLLAYITPDGIALRPLDSFESRLLPDTRGTTSILFSPEGDRLAFTQDSNLKWVMVGGGAVVTVGRLAGLGGGMGLTWTDGGHFLLGGISDGIVRLSENGGELTELTTVSAEAGENIHAWPTALPGTDAFVYTALGPGGGWADSKIVYFDPATGTGEALLEGVTATEYSSTGHLLFVDGSGTLLAAAFDAETGEMGTAEPVVSGVRQHNWGGLAAYAISQNGVLAWLTGNELENNRLVTVDREGSVVRDYGAHSTSWFKRSRSGDRLAINRPTGDNIDTHLLDLATGEQSRFTLEIKEEESAIWSPDDQRLMWAPAQPGGGRTVLVQPIDRSEEPELVFEHPYHLHLTDWSADGRYVAFADFHPTQGQNIYLVDLEDSARVIPIEARDDNQDYATFSPDGRWLTYTSDETGGWEVFAVSVPEGTGKRQISSSGGHRPDWSDDELFYLDVGPFSRDPATIIARALRPGGNLVLGPEQPLFALPLFAAFQPSPDGSRFHTLRPRPEARAQEIRVMLNWVASLEGR